MSGPIKNIAIIGAGFMGKQIATQAAVHGCSVRLYDSSSEAIARAGEEFKNQMEGFFSLGLLPGKPEEILARISYHGELPPALAGADLVLEAAPENLELKKRIFRELEKYLPDGAILATNSSSIPVSKIEDAVECRERVANIHFYAPVSKNNFVDIMGGSCTGEGVVERCAEWIKGIGCIPLVVKKECMGFVFNRVWHAVKRECLASWAGGHADYRDIDRAWMVFTGMGMGPFGMMDGVGLDVVYDIEMEYFKDSNDPKDRPPQRLKDMIDRGELGLKTKKGFYDWTNPEFARPDFIKK